MDSSQLYSRTPLYPCLEDMNMDMMETDQRRLAGIVSNTTMYPGLADFMGLELSTEDMLALRELEHTHVPTPDNAVALNTQSGIVAPLTGGSVAIKKAFVTQGVRYVQLCKDAKGKVGLRLRSVNNGVFVCLVIKNSPSSMAGLRFGDQILEINDKAMAGLSMEAAHKILKDAPANSIKMAVRDRPFERTITLVKNSTGTLGFQFKEGKITTLVKDSSAARNGLLIDHQLVEINGQNVVGLKDKEVREIISSAESVVTLTILPYSIYKHMVHKMSINLMSSDMDHTPIA